MLGGFSTGQFYLGQSPSVAGESVSTESITKSITYTIVDQAAIAKDLTYLIATNVAVSKQLQYTVSRSQSAIEKSLTYKTTSDTSIAKTLKYAIARDVSVSKQLTYAIFVGASSIQKSMRYALVLADNVIQKSLQYLGQNRIYEKSSETTLPNNITTLTQYDSTDYANALDDDDQYADISDDNGFLIHQFRNLAGSRQVLPLSWIGKSTLAPSISTVYLQIYNVSTDEWETVDSDNTTAANTEFTLSATITSDADNYKDNNLWIVCRVYQEIG